MNANMSIIPEKKIEHFKEQYEREKQNFRVKLHLKKYISKGEQYSFKQFSISYFNTRRLSLGMFDIAVILLCFVIQYTRKVSSAGYF